MTAAISLAFGGIASAGIYEDCVLENMKGAANSAAVSAIRKACEVKATPTRCRDDALRPAVEKETSIREARRADEQRAIDRECDEARAKNEICSKYGPGYFSVSAETEAWKEMRTRCLRECESATWYARKFGDCRTG